MADGSVTIKAMLDASGVESGARRVKASVEDIGSSSESNIGGRFGKAVDGAAGKAQSFGERMGGASVAVQQAGDTMTSSVSVPLMNIAKDSVDTAAQFEQSMLTIQTMTGASGDEMQQMSDYATEMGASTVFSSNEAADAMVMLSKAGMSNAEIMGGGLNAALTLATAGEMSLSDAAGTVANSMNQFGLDASQANEATAALAGAANASTADVSDLALGLSQCGTMAASAHWSIQDTTGALGAFAAAGINGSDAGTSLKQMLMSLENPADSTAKLMDQLGISLYNQDGSMKSVCQVADMLRDKLGGMSEEQRNSAMATIFGSDAVRVANVLYNEGSEGLQKYIDAASDQNAAQDLAQSKMSGTSGAIEQMNGAVDTAKQKLGEALAPAVQTLAGFIGDLADRFANLPAPVQTAIAVIGGVAAAIGPLLSIVGMMMGGFISLGVAIPMIGAALGAVGSAIGAVVSAISPVGLAIAAVIVVIKLLWDNCEWFRDGVIGIWNAIGTAITTVVTAIGTFLQGAWTAIGAAVTILLTAIQTVFETVWNAIKTVVEAVITAIAVVIGTQIYIWQTIISTALGIIQGIFSTVWNAISGVVSGVLNAISGVVSSVWSAISGFISAVMGTISGVIAGAWNAISGAVSSAMNAISSTVSGIWNAISSTVSGVVNGIYNAVSGAFNNVLSAASSIFGRVKDAIVRPVEAAKSAVKGIVDAIVGFFRFTVPTPHVPIPHFGISPSGWQVGDLLKGSIPHLSVDWYAKGGYFDRASIIGVGEKGGEYVLNQGHIDELAERLGGGRGDTFNFENIVIEGTGLSPEELMDGLVEYANKTRIMKGRR
jgi:TP901 family phage tail tape measure protein